MTEEVKLKNGAITIYRRSTVKEPIWQVRIKLKNHPQVRKSTGVTDIQDAEEFATELYQELKYKVKVGLPVSSPTFSKICDDYLSWLSNERAAGRITDSKLIDYTRAISNFIKPYFEGKCVDSIQDKDIAEYHQWRRDYWITGPGSKESKITYQRSGKTVVAPRPIRKGTSERRLNYENTMLRQIFEFARTKGYLKKYHIPTIKNKKHKSTRRPYFTQEELANLLVAYKVENWSFQAEIKRGRSQETMGAWELTDLYIHLMVYTGMRPGEAHALRWCDIKDHELDDGTTTVLLSVRGKKKERELVARCEARDILKMIRKRRDDWAKAHTQTVNKMELVLSQPDGTPIKSFYKSFNTLLKKADLEKDNHGRKRSEYSLRHTYATDRLQYAEVDIHLLAVNMGTSVGMIEKHYSHLLPKLAAERLTRMGKQKI